MQSLPQVIVVNRFRPQLSGSTNPIPLLKVKPPTGIEVVLPESSMVLLCNRNNVQWRRMESVNTVFDCNWIADAKTSQVFHHSLHSHSSNPSFIILESLPSVDCSKEKIRYLLSMALTEVERVIRCQEMNSIVYASTIINRNEGLLPQTVRGIFDTLLQSPASYQGYSIHLTIIGVYGESSVDFTR